MEPDLKEFFKVAGISDQELTDKDTRTFIYSFINQHGGVDKAIASIKNPPSTPTSQPSTNLPHNVPSIGPSPGHRVPTHAPPPPPARNGQHKTSFAPPPPPPPPNPAQYSNSGSIPTLPSIPAPPPPPPLPPPNFIGAGGQAMHSNPAVGIAPPPVPKVGPVSHVPDNRNALLDQIKLGAKLNHVDAESESLKSNNSSNSGNGDTRDALLKAIQGGVHLKKVEKSQTERPTSGPLDGGGLAGALARALQERKMVIQQTDESSSDTDEDGDEDDWDD